VATGGALAWQRRTPLDEYGTTTGRPRRVGWLDGVLLRYASRINGLTEMAITKLDILSGLEKLQICIAYSRMGKSSTTAIRGNKFNRIRAGLRRFFRLREDISGVREWNHLPFEAKTYLDRIADLVGAPVRLVSVGPERTQVVEKR